MFELYLVVGNSSTMSDYRFALVGIVNCSPVLCADEGTASPPLIIVCIMSLKACLNENMTSAEPLHQQATDTLPSAAWVSCMCN